MATHTDTLGVQRRLGYGPSSPHLVAARPGWRAAGNPVIPAAEWRAFDYTLDAAGKPFVPIKDQGQYGACNGHTAAELVEYSRMVEGFPHVELSAWWVYAKLCNGVDRGSGILDALALTSTAGVCRDELIAHGTIDPRGFTRAMADDAARFRVTVGSQLATFAEVMSAAQIGRPCNIAVCVTENGPWDLDAEGVPPPNEGGVANHSVTVVPGAKYSNRWGWLVKVANHWTPQWGVGGFFYASAHHLNVRYFEAYDVVATNVDPQDPAAGVLS